MTAPDTVPACVAHLPVCPRRGLPIPATSGRDRDTGAGKFGVNDPDAKLLCALGELCGVCGYPFDGQPMIFLAADKRPAADPARLLFTDPANHPDCAEAAMILCPYIARPRVGHRVVPAEPKPGWLWVATRSYDLAPGRPPGVRFTFRPGPLSAVRRFRYDGGTLTEVTP